MGRSNWVITTPPEASAEVRSAERATVELTTGPLTVSMDIDAALSFANTVLSAINHARLMQEFWEEGDCGGPAYLARHKGPLAMGGLAYRNKTSEDGKLLGVIWWPEGERGPRQVWMSQERFDESFAVVDLEQEPISG